MMYDFSDNCIKVDDIIGIEVLHTSPGYGKGKISNAYIHPDDPEKRIYIYIEFENGKDTSYFDLDKVLNNRKLASKNGVNSTTDPFGDDLSIVVVLNNR